MPLRPLLVALVLNAVALPAFAEPAAPSPEPSASVSDSPRWGMDPPRRYGEAPDPMTPYGQASVEALVDLDAHGDRSATVELGLRRYYDAARLNDGALYAV